MKKISFLATRKLLIMALSSQGQQKPNVPIVVTPERMASSLNAQKGKGRDSCSQETSALDSDSGIWFTVITFSPVPMILREFEQRKKLEYLVNEDLQFSRRLWVGT